MTEALLQEVARMSPAQRHQIDAAHAPISTATAAEREIEAFLGDARGFQDDIARASRRYRDDTALPDSIPDDARATVRDAAEKAVRDVEVRTLRELRIRHERASSVVAQLEQAASQPSLARVPTDTLDAANRFAPLIESQLAGASLEAISSRLSAALVRDDPGEVLAYAIVVGRQVSARLNDPNDDSDDGLLWHLRDTVKAISDRWPDRGLAAALDHARTVESTLDDLDQTIIRDHKERTGASDVYGFLSGRR